MVKVTFDLDAISRSLNQVALDLINGRQELLDAVGAQILALSCEAYDAKSKRTTGSDGIQWAPLRVGTVLARLRRSGDLASRTVESSRPHASIPVGRRQKAVLQVNRKVKGNDGLFDALANAGIDFYDHRSGKKLGPGTRNKSRAVLIPRKKNSLQNTINLSGYDIGVNTGLQRAAGSPAYRGDHQTFTKTEVSVTVGYNMKYSKYFDRKRKLLPDEVPEEWMKELESIVEKHLGVKLEQACKANGLS